jgi:hypothetical protein
VPRCPSERCLVLLKYVACLRSQAIGSSFAHRLGGSSAQRLVGSSAHRLNGSTAQLLNGSSAHRLRAPGSGMLDITRSSTRSKGLVSIIPISSARALCPLLARLADHPPSSDCRRRENQAPCAHRGRRQCAAALPLLPFVRM